MRLGDDRHLGLGEPDAIIGTQVGPFAIVRLRGEGGPGKVYLAEHAVLRTRHAMKVLAPPLIHSEQLVRCHVNEARAAAKPPDRNLSDLIQLAEVEQLPGGAWFIVCELADGLGVAHEHAIVHPDPAGRLALAQSSARGLGDAGAGSRYQLGERLGSGGMAEVFSGTMIGVEGFARRVAIKRVLSGLSQVPAFAKMFVAEAQIASRLAHPNIVSVLDFSRDPENRLFLVMEFVDGKNLASLVEAGPIPPSIALFIAVELLRGLGYAHNLPHLPHLAPHPPLAPDPDPGDPACDASAPRGVIHRDVSPQNLLLSYEGAVKVSDFGLAKVRAASDGVWSGTVRGKPSYMSPEQVAGEKLDGRTDLYAVGVMLWEMLAHRPLFAGTTREILGQVMFRDVAAPSSFRRHVPVDLEAIAMKLLARDRGERYPTAEAAIEALLRCDDVPRDGRGDLAHLLSERFPRASGAPPQRKTGEAPTGAPPAPRAEQITRPAPPSVPDVFERAAIPSIRALARPRRRVFAATLSGVAVVVAAALVIARGEVAQSETTDRVAAPRAAPVEPAGPPRAVPKPSAGGEVTPIDAGAAALAGAVRAPQIASAPTGARAPSRPAPVHRDRGRAARTGELAVIVKPWAMIWLNGKPSGQTPFRAPVPAGRYRVRLVNDDVAQNETTTVTVEPGQTATVERSW
jgi:serine/threonine-protein kinase